jgi:hypothetical protein
LKSAQGEIVRVAVNILDGVVLVCRTEEYQRAKREGREPLAIGFKVSDVLT